MDPFFVKAIQLLLSLSFLIVLHELGHFIPARLFGIRVEKFYLFFDVKFSLFKKKIGDTVYGIGWLPLGGYVKIAGMIDESMDTDALAEAPKPYEFRSKPAWQRLIVMLGGVTVNIIVGIVIYSCILGFNGDPYTTADNLKNGFGFAPTMEKYGFQQGDKILDVNGKHFEDQLEFPKMLMMRNVGEVTVLHENGQTETLQLPENIGMEIFQNGDMPGVNYPRTPVTIDSVFGSAEKAGILPTDKLVSLNDYPIKYKSDFTYALQKNRDSLVHLTVQRNGVEESFNFAKGEKDLVGIQFKFPDTASARIKRQVHQYGIGKSITEGVSYGYWILHDYVKQFKYVFTAKGATQVGGFGAIGNLFPDSWNWLAFWETTALLSIILAFMNILPIPALDGGHVMFLLYEIVTGKAPSDKFLEYAQIIGFFILIALVLFANGNDVYRWITGG